MLSKIVIWKEFDFCDAIKVKDNVTLRVRIIRTWMQPVFGKPNVNNLELILQDEQDTRIQGQVRVASINKFKHQLEEGKAVTLQGYSLGEIQPKFRIVKKGLRLSFLSTTIVEPCPDFTGSIHGFQFRPFNSIVGLKNEEDGQFDVIGQVVACGDLDNFEKNGKPGKKKPLVLIDSEGVELNCTLWGAFAQEFSDFLTKCDDHGTIIAVVQLCMMKIWDGKMGVQNGYNGTKLFLFNANDTISTAEFNDVADFRQSLADNKGNDKSDNATSRISVASKNSTKEDFVVKSNMRNIADLLDVAKGVHSIILGTICAVQEDECWWYIGCRTCKKRVVKSSEIVDLDSDIPPKQTGGATEWYCSKCKINGASIKTMFRLQIRVQDETGTVSLSLFNDEVQAVVDRSAYQLCDKYGKSADSAMYPPEIMNIVGKKYAFKVALDDYNSKKLLPVFTVLRLSNDPEIIESLRPSTTPHKENEATSGNVPEVTPFDLESQMDDNTTPTNTAEKSNKRHSDTEAGSESSNAKKQFVEVKIEKEP